MIEARHFPESMHEIVEAIGVDATLALVKAYGGSRVRIPYRLPDDHPVVKLIGMRRAKIVAKICGGERFDVPRCQSIESAMRADEILKMKQQKKTMREISRAHGMTERGVAYLLAKLRNGA